jgi:hypothetical protein
VKTSKVRATGAQNVSSQSRNSLSPLRRSEYIRRTPSLRSSTRPCVLQSLEVLRNRRSGDWQTRGEDVLRVRSRAQTLEHLAAGRIGEDSEGNCVSHG